jgi:hypothetical protein
VDWLMPRYANPFQSPYPNAGGVAMQSIGANLATALFGDPDLRAQAQLRRAQQDQALASADYDRARTAGEYQGQGGLRQAGERLMSLFQPTNSPSFTPPPPVGAPGGNIAAPQIAVTPQSANDHLAPMSGDPSDLVRSIFPQARITSGARTQAEQDALVARGVTSAHNSDHVIKPGSNHRAVDMAPMPGMSLADVVSGLDSHGLHVLQSLNESGHGPNQGTGPHWHIGFEAGQPSGPGTASAAAGREQPATANLPGAPPMLAEAGGPQIDMESLAHAVAGFAQAKQDPTHFIATMLAAAGGDANARAALEMLGTAPGKDFAGSREAQVNNASRDQYSDLARAVVPENVRSETSIDNNQLDNTTSAANNAATNATSRANNAATQAGEDRRNSENNARAERVAAADREAGKFERRDAAHNVSPNQLANIDSEIDATIGADAAHSAETGSSITYDAKAAVRKRATELINGGTDPATAVQQAIREKTARKDTEVDGKVVGGHYRLREDKPQNRVVNTGARTVQRGKDGKLSFAAN